MKTLARSRLINIYQLYVNLVSAIYEERRNFEMFLKLLFATFLLSLTLAAVKADSYDDSVIYTVHKGGKLVLHSVTFLLCESNMICNLLKLFRSTSFVWELGTNLTSNGCDKDGNISFVIHGLADSQAIWAPPLMDLLLQYRNGCAIFVDWGAYADNILKIRQIEEVYWTNVAMTLVRRVQALGVEGVLPSQLYLYGHSIGARIAAYVGIELEGKIPFIDRNNSSHI